MAREIFVHSYCGVLVLAGLAGINQDTFMFKGKA